MNDLENSTIHCHNRFVRKRLAGERYFESPKECFTGKADEEGYCRGATYGETCSNNGDADCDVDMYCSDKKVCEHARLEGEPCDTREKCASYLICAWEDGINYKCRPYGYHQDGQALGPGDDDEICRSKYLNKEYMCEQGPRLTHSNIRDTPGEKCVYTHGDQHFARCWYHPDGKPICRKGAGDMQSEWQTVLSYLGKHPKCHVDLPLAQCDMGRKVMESDQEWEDTWFSLSRLHWENQMEGVLDCMKHFVHPEAFKYQMRRKSAGSFLSVSVLAMIPLALLLLL